MAVQFIIGASGTGKSEYIYRKMIEQSMNKQNTPILFILPEQANMAAEQDMVSLHPFGGTMDISILSFTRLAYQVFDKNNIYIGDVLDDYGKSMLLMKVIRDNSDKLTYYTGMSEKSGFIDELKSVISEFYQYMMTPDKIDGILDNISPDKSIYHKLKDLKIIIDGFEAAMGDTYMVAEKMLTLLAENVEASDMLRNADVYFDAFTGFTPIQYEVISRIMRCCGNMYFTITMDASLAGDNSELMPEHSGLFKIGRETMAKINRLAADNGVKVLPHISLYENHRISDNTKLSHIERNLFRFPVKEYNGKDDNLTEVKIIECEKASDEIRCIGRLVKNYVMKEGYNYRDISVMTGDLGDNAAIWKHIMDQMDIPCFIDINEPLLHNPMVELVSMVIDMFEMDFSFDSVFSFLKTGFIDINGHDIYLLENYALQYGVKGMEWWSKPFKGGVKGLAAVNSIRKKFMDAIDELIPVFSAKENYTREYVQCIYHFFVKFELGKKLWKQSKSFEQDEDYRKARVYEKAYEKLLMVLDKTIDIIGDEIISRSTLKDVLNTGLSDMNLGVIPSTLDQITVGDMERTRLHHVKILIISGANEGLLPKSAASGGMISRSDRELLKELGVELAPDMNDSYYNQQFYMYMQITQASEKLIVMYRKSDTRGNILNRSFFLKYIIRMFPDIEILDYEHMNSLLLPVSRRDMLEELACEFSDEEFHDSSVYVVMNGLQKKDVIMMEKGYLYVNIPGDLNEAVAEKLYGSNMIHSVSRLETYASCGFKFFLQFGVKVNKREEYKVESNNIGTILHKVMEEYFIWLKERRMDGLTTDIVDDKLILEKVDELTDEASKDFSETIFDSSFRMKHQIDVIKRIAYRSVKNLMRHLEEADMTPEYFEFSFSPEDDIPYTHMKLDNDVNMGLKGIIDRVDIKETEDTVYVKVIDYKSGEKDLDFTKIAEGKQLQLTVYLSVMMDILRKTYPDKKIVPVGMFYFQMADKIAEGIAEDDIELDRMKKSRMSGAVNKDDRCLEYLDGKTGHAVLVNYKQDGELSKANSHLYSEDDLLAVSRYTRDKMIELGNKIIRGQIAMTPPKGKDSPCNYCDYRSVCRFEAGLGGNEYGTSSGLKENAAKELILGKRKDNELDK